MDLKGYRGPRWRLSLLKSLLTPLRVYCDPVGSRGLVRGHKRPYWRSSIRQTWPAVSTPCAGVSRARRTCWEISAPVRPHCGIPAPPDEALTGLTARWLRSAAVTDRHSCHRHSCDRHRRSQLSHECRLVVTRGRCRVSRGVSCHICRAVMLLCMSCMCADLQGYA